MSFLITTFFLNGPLSIFTADFLLGVSFLLTCYMNTERKQNQIHGV